MDPVAIAILWPPFHRIVCDNWLMKGMATIPQGNQELLVVRDKVGRPPGELGVRKSMECDIFPSVL